MEKEEETESIWGGNCALQRVIAHRTHFTGHSISLKKIFQEIWDYYLKFEIISDKLGQKI